MLRAHCPALGRCFSSIWRRCYFWGCSYLVLRGQTQIQRSQCSFSYYTYLEYHNVLIISLSLLPPNLKSVTTLSHLILYSLHLLPDSAPCPRKFLMVELSLLRSENRSILRLLFPPPLPAAAAWANYLTPEVPPHPNVLDKIVWNRK